MHNFLLPKEDIELPIISGKVKKMLSFGEDSSNRKARVYCLDTPGKEMKATWSKSQDCYICKDKDENENFVRCRNTIVKADNQEEEEKSVLSEKNATILQKLSFLDRYLSLWIILAMVVGVIIGYLTNASVILDATKVDTVSLPIAIGLWLMMWPVLCKVRYELLGDLFTERGMWRQIGTSLLLNWVVGPLIMTILAWITLSDLPGYRNGLILVGLARCIAMVLIWNQLAQGHAEYCAVLVAINSIMQILLYAPLAVIYLKMGSQEQQLTININFWDVCKSVMIFLGAPFVAGVVTRYTVIFTKGRTWFDEKFLPVIGPIALIALIYTILILFALQGHQIIDNIANVFRVSVPMFLYFGIMWVCTLLIIRRMEGNYEQSVTQAFTAASNNFELAIAIAVGTFGANSEEALAATVGPLIEVPVLLFLVYVALWLKTKLRWPK